MTDSTPESASPPGSVRMPRKRPNGYYIVLVAGAVAHLRHQGMKHPTKREVFYLLAKMGLVSKTDQTAQAACYIAFGTKTVRLVRDAPLSLEL